MHPVTPVQIVAPAAVATGSDMGPVTAVITRRKWSSEVKDVAAFVQRVLASILLVQVIGQATAED